MANAYFYSNTAVATTLAGNISSGATSISVAATTGFPASTPYVLALDYGAATEELVLVTAAAGTSLTVTRGFGSTSAQSHSLGAVVRHVVNAVDLTDFRTHEAATAAVHGVAGTIVGTSDTQTLANKTLTSPTINGAALSGTFTGSPTLSGAPTFSGAALFTGGPSFTTNSVLFSRGAATDIGPRTRVTGDTQDRLQAQADGKLLWGSGSATPDAVLYREAAGILATEGVFRVIRASASNNAFAARVTGDTNSRVFINADGEMNWGPGSTTADVNLYRSAANVLKTDDSLVVTGSLTASGVGQVLFAYKTADTSRATATPADDPHLTVTLSANAVYEMEALVHIYTTDWASGINLDWSVPGSATGRWTGFGQPLLGPGGEVPDSASGYMRTTSTTVDAARVYGADDESGNPLSVFCKGLVITAGSGGTYACSWARNAGSGTLTMVQNSYLILRRVA